jgi:phage terminase large subunit-like protein
MLEWSVPEDADITDAKEVKKANPASWITARGLRGQHEAVAEVAYRRYHCNQWTARVGAWLPAGAWQACSGKTEFTPGERIWVGVDVGGERSNSSVVWVNENLHVGVETWSGDDAVLEVAAFVSELADRYYVVEAVFDPWRAGQMAAEWEQRGIVAVAFPHSDSRMIPASEALYDAIVHGRIVHPDDEYLNAHVHAAVARHSRRGWRLERPDRSTNIDGAVALAMAVDRHAFQDQSEVEILAWL